jgi:hypothetical protein
VSGVVRSPGGASDLQGYTLSRGEIALSGSNPTVVDTGLSSIKSAQATVKRTTAPSSGTAFVTVNFAATGGILELYSWNLSGSSSPGTEVVGWMAIGMA